MTGRPLPPGRLYYSLKEVAAHFEVPTSTVLFWERKYSDKATPKKTATGRRQYTAKDVEALRAIYHHTKERGMTHRETERALKNSPNEATKRAMITKTLEELHEELLLLLKHLDVDLPPRE